MIAKSDAYLDCVDSEFSESEDDVLLEFGDSSDSSDDDVSMIQEMGETSLLRRRPVFSFCEYGGNLIDQG